MEKTMTHLKYAQTNNMQRVNNNQHAEMIVTIAFWIVLCCTSLLTLSTTAKAEQAMNWQTSSDSLYQQIINDISYQPMSNVAASALNGDNLNVSISQHGEGNISINSQQGSESTITTKQHGYENLSLINQIGDSNHITVKQYHLHNDSAINQVGNDSNIHLKQTGVSRANIEQYGDGKSLYIYQPPYTKITIKQGQ